jgi:Kef-type K+ transport system membrane component KefB
LCGHHQPIFFASTGLKTDIGSLHSAAMWFWAAVVLLAGVVGKLAGCGLTAYACGFRPREAAAIGSLMNARGLMELIVINLGYELRVIPPSVFTMLVLMAMITTFMTTPMVLWLSPGTELASHIRRSGFSSRPDDESGPGLDELTDEPDAPPPGPDRDENPSWMARSPGG